MSVDLDKTQTDLAAVVLVGVSGPRVDLLPGEIAAEAAFNRTRLILGACTLGVVGLLAGGWALSAVQAGNAADALAAEQTVTQQLAAEQAKYAAVPVLLNRIDAVRSAQADAMASDVAWYSQLDQINREFPEGLAFDSLQMAMAAPSEVNAAAVPLAEPGQIGSVTVVGTGPNYINGAQWLEVMALHPGFVNPYYSTFALAYNDERKATEVKQSTTVGFTDEIYTHRFDQKAGQ